MPRLPLLRRRLHGRDALRLQAALPGTRLHEYRAQAHAQEVLLTLLNREFLADYINKCKCFSLCVFLSEQTVRFDPFARMKGGKPPKRSGGMMIVLIFQSCHDLRIVTLDMRVLRVQ